MYCTECGTENADDAKFCKNCGQTLQRTSMPVWTDAESGVREPVKRWGKDITDSRLGYRCHRYWRHASSGALECT